MLVRSISQSFRLEISEMHRITDAKPDCGPVNCIVILTQVTKMVLPYSVSF